MAFPRHLPSIALIMFLVILPMSLGEDLEIIREGSKSGLKGLYEMTNNFLAVVQSKTLLDLFDEYEIDKIGDLPGDLLEDYLQLAKSFIGFGTCIVVGFLFILIMPIAGCCYCCCRCCCGGCCFGCCTSKEKKKTKPSKCWTVSCTALALGTSLVIFSFAACAFVSTGVVVEEMDSNALDDVTKSLKDAEHFVTQAVDDTEALILGGLTNLQDDVLESLDNLPASIAEVLDSNTAAETSLQELANFTSQLPNLSSALNTMNPLTYNLASLETNLANRIDAFTSDTGTLYKYLDDDCKSPGITDNCKQAANDLDDLAASSISSQLEDTTAAQLSVDVAMASGIDNDVQDLLGNMETLRSDIASEIEDNIADINNTIIEAVDKADDLLSENLQSLHDFNVDSLVNTIDDLKPDAETYAGYYGHGTKGLAGILLLVAVLWFIGALMGLCGSTTRKHGARVQLAGTSFFFIFGWLIMLITTLTFMLGGFVHLFVCQHLVGFDDTAQRLFEMAEDQFLDGFDYNISLNGVIMDCKDNAPLYDAARLEDNGINITELLDLNQYGFFDEIDKLGNMTFNLGTVDVINDNVNATMIALDATLNDVDYDNNLMLLGQPITSDGHDMQVLLADLQGIVAQLQVAGETTLADDMAAEISTLQGIINSEFKAVQDARDDIEKATLEAQHITESISLPQVINDLSAAQNEFSTSIDTMVQEALSDTLEDMVTVIENFVDDVEHGIKNDIAPCRPVYDIFQAIIYAPCVYFLYPFNSAWFAYGGGLAFGILGMIFTTKVVGYYRRLHDQATKVHPDKNGYQMNYVNGGQVVTPAV